MCLSASSVCVCLGGGAAAERAVMSPAALCITCNEFVKQYVKITTTFKSFITQLTIAYILPFIFTCSFKTKNFYNFPQLALIKLPL